MSQHPDIAVVADASLGYGSPQIPAFVRSLEAHYGGKAVVFEPDTPGKQSRHHLYPDLRIERVQTGLHPYTTAGRVAFVLEAARRIDELRPVVLVIFCTYAVPVLTRIRCQPGLVVYYSIESIAAYGKGDIALNRLLAPAIDLLIFPEENRAARDIERCGFHRIPTAIVYNSANPREVDMLPAQRRNGRFLNQGTIGTEYTFAQYYLRERTQRLPIDLYGPIEGKSRVQLASRFASLRGDVRYQGVLDLVELERRRREYAYSIVIWNPDTERGLFAPSNKFFESVASGVPPITAPHPQHKLLVERYQCGLVMEDWSFAAFLASLEEAMALYGTEHYARMVANCRRAVDLELHWDEQFRAVAAKLPARETLDRHHGRPARAPGGDTR